MKKRSEYLNAIGVNVWTLRDESGEQEQVDVTSVSTAMTSQESHALSSLDELQQTVAACSLCALCKSRNNIVFGVGNGNADVMLVGEAPGENEDLQGEPFVGRAGMLLNQMLLAIGLERPEVYIANILKCRPPRNRDPLPEEVALCTPYLQQQIGLIKPKVIIAVGRVAAHYLLNTEESMGKLRGQIYHYGELQTPLFVIYHPAYLLRSPREKIKAYVDLQKIQQFLHNL